MLVSVLNLKTFENQILLLDEMRVSKKLTWNEYNE